MSTHVRNVNTTAGILQNAPVELVQGLNCIIGARGTCKSTLVESIRFAFDLNEEKIRVLCSDPAERPAESQAGLIRSCLKAGTVRCEVVVEDKADKTIFSLEREVDGSPRTFKEGVLEYSKSAILEMVEIYSQGDLQRIAENKSPGLRLELIDRPNKFQIKELKKNQKSILNRLVDIGPRIRVLRADIAAKKQTVRVVPELQQQLELLRQARPELPADLEMNYRRAQERKALLSSLAESIHAALVGVKHLRSSRQIAQQLDTRLNSLSSSSESLVADASAQIAKLKDILQRAALAAEEFDLDILNEKQRALSEKFERENAEYYKLRQEQQLLNESLKKEETLRAQIEHLERAQVELNEITEECGRLSKEREALRSQSSAICGEIFNLRLAEVEKINKKHSDFVVLALTPGTEAGDYEKRINELLSKSRIRLQEQVAHDIAVYLKPFELISLLEEANASRLAEILHRDVGQMTRVVAHLSDHPALYELEAQVFEDRLEITMYDGGVSKPVEILSEGQKATALLPLILRPAPYPLVFDQPEDDLDNSFIYKSLIKVVRELKSERQLIFVTHNANIPVLGDADRVIVMSMRDPSTANAALVGSVDERKKEILDLLEGGKEAFRQRETKYEPLLREL